MVTPACPGGQEFILFEHSHLAYQIDGDEKRNRKQVKFSTWDQINDLDMRSKCQISLNFHYKDF